MGSRAVVAQTDHYLPSRRAALVGMAGLTAAGALALSGCSGASLTAAQVAEIETILTSTEAIAGTIATLAPLLGVDGVILAATADTISGTAALVLTYVQRFQADKPATGGLSQTQIVDATTALADTVAMYEALPTTDAAAKAKLDPLLDAVQSAVGGIALASNAISTAIGPTLALGAAIVALQPDVNKQLSVARLSRAAAMKDTR